MRRGVAERHSAFAMEIKPTTHNSEYTLYQRNGMYKPFSRKGLTPPHTYK